METANKDNYKNYMYTNKVIPKLGDIVKFDIKSPINKHKNFPYNGIFRIDKFEKSRFKGHPKLELVFVRAMENHKIIYSTYNTWFLPYRFKLLERQLKLNLG